MKLKSVGLIDFSCFKTTHIPHIHRGHTTHPQHIANHESNVIFSVNLLSMPHYGKQLRIRFLVSDALHGLKRLAITSMTMTFSEDVHLSIEEYSCD